RFGQDAPVAPPICSDLKCCAEVTSRPSLREKALWLLELCRLRMSCICSHSSRLEFCCPPPSLTFARSTAICFSLPTFSPPTPPLPSRLARLPPSACSLIQCADNAAHMPMVL